MNPINLKVSSISPQPSANNTEGNGNPLQQNPIPSQPGVLITGSNNQNSSFDPVNNYQDLLSIAQDRCVTSTERFKAAQKINDQSLKDRAYLAIAQDIQADRKYRFICAALISNVVDQDQAWIVMAQDKNLKPSKRIEAAGAISQAFEEIRDAILLEIAKDCALDVSDRMHAIVYISADKKDQAFIAIAQDPNVTLSERKTIAEGIKDQVSRDIALIHLFNDLISLGEEDDVLEAEAIINHIQDPNLQALAREALAAGEIVRLMPAKSAPKVSE